MSVFTISFSIGIPIYFRPFYYMQIEPLGIPEATGYTKDVIIDAYDEVLDFLTLPGGSFSAGAFKFTADGASHFEDCKWLFTLNLFALIISSLALAFIFVFYKRKRLTLIKPYGFSVGFYSGVLTLSLFLVLGLLVAVDFDRAFVVFHSLFFPGKDNWIFDPRYDQIILAMPEQFFMNCAIVIASSIIVISLLLVALGIIGKRKNEAETHITID